MNNNSFTFLFITIILLTTFACKKDCEVIQADWSPKFLYHDGMAPEGVRLEAAVQSADNYLWEVEGVTSSKIRDTFTLATSGDYDVSLVVEEGKHKCRQGGTISIRDYPYLNSDRALSFFESDGSNVRLIARVLDNDLAENYVAISYDVGLPENGGGMDYDNATKKLFASPLALLASCFPNNADLQFPIPPDETSNRVFHDTALDPDDDLAYVSGVENGSIFIRSTTPYDGDGSTQEIYTEPGSPEFVYLTTDRANNVIYWTKRGGDTIYKIERDSMNKVFLTGGPFYDLDFDNNKGWLFFAEDQDSSFGIRTINPETGQQREDAKSINGEVTFIYVDEEEQEVFWVNDDSREIWKKRVSFQMNSADKLIENVGKIRGMAVGNFVVD